MSENAKPKKLRQFVRANIIPITVVATGVAVTAIYYKSREHNNRHYVRLIDGMLDDSGKQMQRIVDEVIEKMNPTS